MRKKRLTTNKLMRPYIKLLRKKKEEKPIKSIKDTYRTSYNLHRRTMTWAGVQSECYLLSQSLLQESSNPHPAL